MIIKFVGMCSSHKVRSQVIDKGNLYFFLYYFLFFYVCSLLAGCASFVLRTPVIVETRIIKAGGDASSVNFELIGRVLAQGKDRVFTGGVRWSHANTDDNIQLLSPFGQTLVEINSNKDSASLTTSKNKTYRASNVEELTKQVMGWQLPILGLQYWVHGVNSPKTGSEVDWDENGQIIEIRQDGWIITYTDHYSSQLIQTSSPRILVLERSDIKIKLVIDNWIVR
tara:strand:+ start:5628 stop:6302 length:675 start_codon:yes stop_codon:yes gene_type:complete